MERIRRFCKASAVVLFGVLIPLLLIGCGQSDAGSSGHRASGDTRSETSETGSYVAIGGGSKELADGDIDEYIS